MVLSRKICQAGPWGFWLDLHLPVSREMWMGASWGLKHPTEAMLVLYSQLPSPIICRQKFTVEHHLCARSCPELLGIFQGCVSKLWRHVCVIDALFIWNTAWYQWAIWAEFKHALLVFSSLHKSLQTSDVCPLCDKSFRRTVVTKSVKNIKTSFFTSLCVLLQFVNWIIRSHPRLQLWPQCWKRVW